MFIAPDLQGDELAVRAEIARLADEMSSQLRQGSRWTGALRRTTFARNVHGSNSIEGIHASVDEIEALAAGESDSRLGGGTARALVAYQSAMTYVLQLAQEPFSLDVSLLKSLHFIATSYDLAAWPGRFRDGAVYVQESATGDIVYEGAEPERISGLLSDFVDTVFGHEDTLVAAAMAHLNLVLIHPFKDGNGRMARIVQSLVFAADGEFSPLFSTVEECLGKRAPAYYAVLAQVGRGKWDDDAQDAETSRPWLRFMLTAHLNQALERLHRTRAAGDAAAGVDACVARAGLPERTSEALYGTLFGGTITRARYLAALSEAGEPVSEQTASRDLLSLSAAGLLVAEGDKRGRRYLPGAAVQALRVEAGLGRAWRHVDPFAR